MNLGQYSSYLHIDLDAVRDNMRAVLRHADGMGVIPVVKGNAYNIGIEPVTRLLVDEFGVDIVGLAQVYEGVQMRRAGFLDTELLIMGAPLPHNLPDAVAHDLQLTIFTPEQAEALSAALRAAGKTTAQIQLKIETGMHRLGVRPGDALAQLLDTIARCGNLDIVGVFTHFATAAQRDSAFTRQQYATFCDAVAQVRAAGHAPRYIHCSNSGATLWLREAAEVCTHVRPGSMYMGYVSEQEQREAAVQLREPLSWRAYVCNVTELAPGQSVGYARHFAPERASRVATGSIGYGDGLFRPMAMDGAPVLVGGARARYVGCCMDNCFIDVTDIDCNIGDEVTIFGHSTCGAYLSVFELERFTGQCYQTMLCGINERVGRLYSK